MWMWKYYTNCYTLRPIFTTLVLPFGLIARLYTSCMTGCYNNTVSTCTYMYTGFTTPNETKIHVYVHVNTCIYVHVYTVVWSESVIQRSIVE